MPKYRGLTNEDLREWYEDEDSNTPFERGVQNENNGPDLDRLNAATPEFPVFIEGTLQDGWGDYMSPSWKGLFAVTGPRESDDYDVETRYSLYALRVDEPYSQENRSRPLQFGDFITRSDDALKDMSIVQNPEAERLYKECQDLHENAPFVVQGRLYTDHPVDEYSYGSIPGTERTWEMKDERLPDGSAVNSLAACEAWIVHNHPAYLPGCGIHQDCPSGDFECCVVPSPYGGRVEDVAYRWAKAKELADHYGVPMGTKTWDDELTECLGAEKDKVIYQAEHPQQEQHEELAIEPKTSSEPKTSARRLPDISNVADSQEVMGLKY